MSERIEALQAEEIAKTIDHTLLRPEATSADVEGLCREAGRFHFAAVCVFPHYVPMAASLLRGTDVKTCTVVSFPYGADTPRIKTLAADEAVGRGADEVDVVINVSALLSGELGLVRDELAGIVRGVRVRSVNTGRGQVIVKAIIETCYLDERFKRLACRICEQAGVDFVKTSTGVGPHGATVKDVELLRDCLDAGIGVKASGGIRTAADAERMIGAGAVRLGTSAGVAIMEELPRLRAGPMAGMDHEAFLALVRYNAHGLVPCVVQDAVGGQVLMVAFADEEAMRATLASGEAHFWSRSRRELWHKGGTSGNVQRVVSLRLDCDHDTVLLSVEPAGPACHTGSVSCFDDAANGGAVTAPAGFE